MRAGKPPAAPPPEVVENIESILPDGFDLPRDRHQLAQILAQVSYRYSGPFPPPELMRGLEDVLPGSADRILAMTERELAAGIDRDKDVRARDDRFRLIGLILGAALILSTFGFSLASLREGNAWIAGLFLGAGVAGIFAKFFNLTTGMAYSESTSTTADGAQKPKLDKSKPTRSARK